LGQRRGLKNPWAGEEDVFLVHPQNGLNSLILNWCTGSNWFTPAPSNLPGTLELFRNLLGTVYRFVELELELKPKLHKNWT
jgi:hypothetical protein